MVMPSVIWFKTCCFSLSREVLAMAESDWRDLQKSSLQELYDAAVRKRESLVPMIANLPLAREDDEVVHEVATMFSYFSGAVTRAILSMIFL